MNQKMNRDTFPSPDQNTYMERCLELASLGLGGVQPNPMVGAVIVANGKIIAEGWHRKYGECHAEIDALRNVKEADRHLLSVSTLYVNLEPCSHTGKTPPCADALILAGIPRVVIGNIDPNSKVNGKGVSKLRDAGIEVETAVLEEKCRYLNRRFFTYHREKRPYVILKWAQTLDGYMDIERKEGTVEQYWITNQELRTIVHKWRSEEDAIMIGYNTYLHDRPQLTTRYFPGKDPVRFILRRDFSVEPPAGFHFIPDSVGEALDRLYEMNIQSVIVEGGFRTIQKFLKEGLWDEARILTGSQCWGKGLPAPAIPIPSDKGFSVLNNRIEYVRRYV